MQRAVRDTSPVPGAITLEAGPRHDGCRFLHARDSQLSIRAFHATVGSHTERGTEWEGAIGQREDRAEENADPECTFRGGHGEGSGRRRA